MEMTAKWGTAGWWVVIILSIPFSIYAGVFVIADFDVYKYMTIAWAAKDYDIAGLNILRHVWAWQIHSLAAEAFMITGPFQFSSSFRKKYPTIHRWMGYVFVGSATVITVSGIVFMNPASEFAISGRTTFFFMGVFMLYYLFSAVILARQRKFKVHQKYMIRGGAIGYSIMAMRIIPAILMQCGVAVRLSMELGALLSPVIFVALAEVYIRTVLDQKPKPKQPAVEVPNVENLHSE